MWKLRCSRCRALMAFARQSETPVALVLRAWLGTTVTGYTGPGDTAVCLDCAHGLGPELSHFLRETVAPS